MPFSSVECEKRYQEIRQKRHLYVTIDELYSLFKEEFPNDYISSAKFAELQPANHRVDQTVPLYSHDFVSDLVCNPTIELCWNNICSIRQNEKLFKFDSESLEEELEINGLMKEAIEELKQQILPFLLHHYIKQKQASMYNSHKSQTHNDTNLAMLQIDFSENYSTLCQDEIQSTRWHKTQITVFSAALWKLGECHPAVTVSDDLSHPKEAILILPC
uniref:Uncharacterized protein n=1 Tax=Octopus bimaculoides TaxID=37653 RepID=A0A0L8FJJ2_OCTBM